MLNRDQISLGERAAIEPGGRSFRSLAEMAEYEPPEQGIQTGLSAIDLLTGGLQPGRLNMFVGYTSHGKTAGMLTTIVNNLDNGVKALFVTCDDRDDDVLRKLMAMRHGMSTIDVMAKGKRWRREQTYELEECLFIYAPEGPCTKDDLAIVMEAAGNRFGELPSLACFDYLTLLSFPGQGEPYAVVSKQAIAMKDVIRTYSDTTWIISHQCNRSAVSGLVPALMTNHVEHGGVKETDGVMIGFRRRKDTEGLTDDQYMEEAEHPSVNVSVMKNKVTGSISPNPVGHKYAIDAVSGIIRDRTAEEIRGKITNLNDVKWLKASGRDRFSDEDRDS